ncbi:hypothetical protein SAMN05216201_11845 [Pseudomonas linyingensis]|uniref:Uncharacterized protein n=1 Tax=Pseudomonas linyingensis TaxID=915471 RepID=A0A1H7BQE4_9PSED|nr:hypothetical protein [Pseudomonas linyingensis]SEJ79244.1 hypothetical protein SAMN05216201_11845 [Pseudomonas linyingensis]
MLLKTYEAQNLLCNLSVLGATSRTDTYAFRGDLVVTEGDIADDAGRRLPPTAVVKQAVVLAVGDKLTMVAGGLVHLADLPLFIERYRGDLAAEVSVLFYVEDLTKALITELDGVKMILLPHEEGAIWNTLMGDLRLDKEDFKGQSAEDKVITQYEALKTFKPKLETIAFETALTFVSKIQREHRGPV